jgi:hypothetical protein
MEKLVVVVALQVIPEFVLKSVGYPAPSGGFMLMICIISFCPDIPSVSQYTFLGLYT